MSNQVRKQEVLPRARRRNHPPKMEKTRASLKRQRIARTRKEPKVLKKTTLGKNRLLSKTPKEPRLIQTIGNSYQESSILEKIL